MNEGLPSLLQEIAKGVKDKFITLCGGALLLSIFYVLLREDIDQLIIRPSYPEFTYLATIVLVLAFTYLMFLVQQTIEWVFANLFKRRIDNRNFERFLKSLTLKELEFVKQAILRQGTGRDELRVRDLAEIENLRVANKVNNVNWQESANEWKFDLGSMRYQIGEDRSRYDILLREIEKKKNNTHE